jgi:hypothetical protein
MRRAALVAVLLMGGCAPYFDIGGGDWTKPGAQIQEVTQDEMDCARTASRAYWTPESFVGGLADVVRVKIEDAQMVTSFSRCMEMKGYHPARS